MMKQRSKKAVSPVLATLMMVAVAVAMSVIIFTWSQSFLSQTSEAASGQQAAQNIAAQSGILIESATFATSTDEVTIYIRNVGAVSNTIGSIIVTGRPDNTGMKKSLTLLVDASGTDVKVTAIPAASDTLDDREPSSASTIEGVEVNGHKVTDNTQDSDANDLRGLAKGESVSVLIDLKGATSGYNIESGDVITIKVTTAAGTFAQATYTVP
jgi:flagellin-like protein